MRQPFTDLTVCPNCDAPLTGRFCAQCGQKVMPVGPTLSYFLHDLTHELLHVDGKIFRSVRLLLFRPGFLTREYFLGRRARYISPIRLYLIFSLAFFAASALPGQPPVFDPALDWLVVSIESITQLPDYPIARSRRAPPRR